MDNVKVIRLYGKMGTKFGRVHHFAVETPAEAVRALCAMIAGFEAYMLQAKDNGLGFAVFAGRKNLCVEELTFLTNKEIRIAPIILGSKQGGWLQVIVGVILIVVGVVFSEFLGPFAAPIVNLGVAMVIGGVVQLLTPHPKGQNTQDKPDNRPNYAFSGTVNTEAQGNPIPVVYGGPLKVGSAVASAGILANEGVYVPLPSTSGSGGGMGPIGSGGGGGGSGGLNAPA